MEDDDPGDRCPNCDKIYAPDENASNRRKHEGSKECVKRAGKKRKLARQLPKPSQQALTSFFAKQVPSQIIRML